MRCFRERATSNQLYEVFSNEFTVTFTSTANHSRTQYMHSHYIHVFHHTPQLRSNVTICHTILYSRFQFDVKF